VCHRLRVSAGTSKRAANAPLLPWRIQLLVSLKESSADREKLHQKREAHNDKKKLQLTRTVHNSLGLQPIARTEQRENQPAIDRSQTLAFRLSSCDCL